jgi:alginate O-acetyltransferase complex protein AlgJ
VIRRRIALLSLLFSYCNGGAAPAPNPVALFAEWGKLAQAAADQKTIVVEGREGWLFFGPELRHLAVGKFWGEETAAVSRARQPEWADPLPAILDFHRQLRELGVELVIMPVPPKAIVYPDMVPSSIEWSGEVPPRLDIQHQAFYALLRENGVEVLDLTEIFLSNRDHADGHVYCQQDTHWSGVATTLAAAQIVPMIRSRAWFLDVPKAAFSEEWKPVEITGDLWSALEEPSRPKEQLRLRFIGSEPDPESPVVLLGDSHTLVFHTGGDMHAEGAGLADQLAFDLGFPVDLVGVRGSGATAARINLLRRAQADPDYWAKKKLVIWCFATRELTESDGWREVPIAP